MDPDQRLTPAEREVAGALGRLAPAAHRIDGDRMMFRAGQLSARRRRRCWQGASVLLAAGLAVALAVRPAPREVERIVRVPMEPAPIAPTAPSIDIVALLEGPLRPESEYIALRRQVMSRGVDALGELEPPPATSGGPSSTVASSLRRRPQEAQAPGLFDLMRSILGDRS